jgi:hypothetical protein
MVTSAAHLLEGQGWQLTDHMRRAYVRTQHSCILQHGPGAVKAEGPQIGERRAVPEEQAGHAGAVRAGSRGRQHDHLWTHM